MTTRPPAEIGMSLDEVDTPALIVDLDVFDYVVIAELELRPAADVRDVLEAAGLEVVDADHAIVPREQRVAKM